MTATETTPAAVQSPAAPAKVAQKAAKKPVKKVPAKAKKAPAKADAGAARANRVTFVKTLRKMGATSGGNAVSFKALSEKLGWDRRTVYGLVNGLAGEAGSSPTCLVATGHAKSAKVEGEGLGVYLTAKGQKTDFTDRPFAFGNGSE